MKKFDARIYEKALKALDEAKDWYVFDPSKDEPVKFREPTKYRGVNDTKEDDEAYIKKVLDEEYEDER